MNHFNKNFSPKLFLDLESLLSRRLGGTFILLTPGTKDFEIEKYLSLDRYQNIPFFICSDPIHRYFYNEKMGRRIRFRSKILMDLKLMLIL